MPVYTVLINIEYIPYTHNLQPILYTSNKFEILYILKVKLNEWGKLRVMNKHRPTLIQSLRGFKRDNIICINYFEV